MSRAAATLIKVNSLLIGIDLDLPQSARRGLGGSRKGRPPRDGSEAFPIFATGHGPGRSDGFGTIATVQLCRKAKTRNSSEAAIITPLAIQPETAWRDDIARRPIARGLRTINIMTTISGPARIPLITAAQ